MLRGNPPPPTSLFFLFLSMSFPSLFKKKSENFGGGGGFEPPEPPLKYALGCTDARGHATLREIVDKMCNLMRFDKYFDQILYYNCFLK